jgi:hypothetical protein
MLTETEIRDWCNSEKQRLAQTADPIEHKCRNAIINTLLGVLSD